MLEYEEDKKSSPSIRKKTEVTINLSDLYSFKSEDLTIDITGEQYSNHAFAHVTPNDVYIDFLTFPGAKRDGKMSLKGTRIYMSHSVAQALIEGLKKSLGNEYKDRAIKTYAPEITKNSEIIEINKQPE